MSLALRAFIGQHGRELVERGLYRNFVLHCCNLFEFGVISPALVFSAVASVQDMMGEEAEIAGLQRWRGHRAAWMDRNGLKDGRKDFSGLFPSSASASTGEEGAKAKQ